MRGKQLLAAFLLGVGSLILAFSLFPNPALCWSSEAWQINAYIGWEFLDMDREVTFYEESWESYPFVVEQKEYMEKVESTLVKELRERFEASFTPLVVVAYRKNDSKDADFRIIDITCKSDSRIYQGAKLGRFEYQYVNILRVSGEGAIFHVPSEVEYTSFWLLPAKSLTEKVYLHGHTSEKIEYKWNRFIIEVEQNELVLIRYIEQLRKRIDDINQQINELEEVIK